MTKRVINPGLTRFQAPSGQVHRFGDAVAVRCTDLTTGGATAYLTVKEARALAAAIYKAARSVERETFRESSGNTFSLTEFCEANKERTT